MSDRPGGNEIGSIYATVMLDTSEVLSGLENIERGAKRTDAALEGIGTAAEKAATKAEAAAERAAKAEEAKAEKAARAEEAKADRVAKAEERSAKAAELRADRQARADERAAAQQTRDMERLQAALKKLEDRTTADHNDALRLRETGNDRAAQEEIDDWARVHARLKGMDDRDTADHQDAMRRRATASMLAAKEEIAAQDDVRAHMQMQAGWGGRHIDFDPSGVRPSSGMGMAPGAMAANRTRTGFAVANMAQDMIQGSPSAGVNNALFIAGDRGMRAVIGETVQAAGGVKLLAAGFGTLAIAAGAAFLVINKGLKDAKLDWGDFGAVVGNLAPIHAVSEAFSGFVEIVSQSPVGTVLGKTWDGVKAAVGFVADVTLGWTAATAAAKAHKDEVIAVGKAIKEAGEAQKALAKFKSEAEEKKEKAGKVVGRELAELGGSDGIEGVVDKIARRMTAKGGDQEVDQEYLDEKGKTQTRKVTKRDLAKEDIRRKFAAATEGDFSGLDQLKPVLGAAGYDLKGVNAGTQGRDLKKEKEQAQAESHAEADVMNDEAVETGKELTALNKKKKADRKKEAAPHAKALLKQFAPRTAAGNAPTAAEVKAELEKATGGKVDELLLAEVGKQLREGYEADIAKRMEAGDLDRGEAEKQIVDEAKERAERKAAHKLPSEKAAEKTATKAEAARRRLLPKSEQRRLKREDDRKAAGLPPGSDSAPDEDAPDATKKSVRQRGIDFRNKQRADAAAREESERVRKSIAGVRERREAAGIPVGMEAYGAAVPGSVVDGPARMHTPDGGNKGPADPIAVEKIVQATEKLGDKLAAKIGDQIEAFQRAGLGGLG